MYIYKKLFLILKVNSNSSINKNSMKTYYINLYFTKFIIFLTKNIYIKL